MGWAVSGVSSLPVCNTPRGGFPSAGTSPPARPLLAPLPPPPVCQHLSFPEPLFASTPSLPAQPLLAPGSRDMRGVPPQPVCGGGGGSSLAGGTVPAPIHRGSSSVPCSPTCSAAATLWTAAS